MRPIQRLLLSARAIGVLDERTKRILNADSPSEKAARLWTRRNNKTFKEVSDTLAQMSFGRQRCMYCEDNEGTDIDHFWPKADFPERSFDWDNYLLACSACNSNYKRNQFPRLKDKPLLVDPTKDDPLLHLVLVPETGEFVELSVRGEKTIKVFGLARESLQQGRRDAWALAELLICLYAKHKRDGEDAKANDIAALAPGLSFSSVWFHVFSARADSAENQRLKQETMNALRDFPEILDWPDP